MLDQEVLNHISKPIKDAFGMTYDEFSKLDFDEQQRLIAENRKMQKKNKSNEYVDVMVGYGEHSTFIKTKKGEKVLIRYGNISEAGLTLEEERQRIEADLADIIYSKPVVFVKKLQRRIKNI